MKLFWMSEYTIELAEEKDDCQLRNMLATNILEGNIAVSFRKSPSFFQASNISGHTKQIIKCTHRSANTIVGMGSRYIYPAYLNGECVNIGYLSDLRVDTHHRCGHILARGYQFLEQLHIAQPVPCYLTMIYSDNQRAYQSIASHRANLPMYHPLGKFLTPAIFLDLAKPAIKYSGVRFECARQENIQEVFNFLQHGNQYKQFAPFYSVSDLSNGRLQGLKANDIYLAIKENRIVGMAAAWDQRTFRQVVVERYHPALQFLYPYYNLLTKISPLKSLPNPGEPLSFFYLALIAIEDNNPEIFDALLRHIYRERVKGPWHYFVCGLHESDPLSQVILNYRQINSYGRLFYIDYNQKLMIDSRVPYIECSTL